MITIHQRHRQTDRQTDRQTTCDRNTALCTKVHRAVKKVGDNPKLLLMTNRKSVQVTYALLIDIKIDFLFSLDDLKFKFVVGLHTDSCHVNQRALVAL